MQRLSTLLLGLAVVGCSRLPSTGQPGPTDAEIQVAALALSDFVGAPDSVAHFAFIGPSRRGLHNSPTPRLGRRPSMDLASNGLAIRLSSPATGGRTGLSGR